MTRFSGTAVVTLMALLACSQAPAAARCTASRIVVIEEKNVTLCRLHESDAWVTPACGQANKPASCGALGLLDSLKTAELVLSQEERQNGKNPSNLVCSKLGGEVVLAQTPTGSQVTLCQAKDKSLIDCNSLYTHFRALR